MLLPYIRSGADLPIPLPGAVEPHRCRFGFSAHPELVKASSRTGCGMEPSKAAKPGCGGN